MYVSLSPSLYGREGEKFGDFKFVDQISLLVRLSGQFWAFRSFPCPCVFLPSVEKRGKDGGLVASRDWCIEDESYCLYTKFGRTRFFYIISF